MLGSSAASGHGGSGLLTPQVLPYGRAEEVIRPRQEVLSPAYQRNLDGFVQAPPKPPELPTAVSVNPPATIQASEGELHSLMLSGVSKSLARPANTGLFQDELLGSWGKGRLELDEGFAP